MTHRRSMRVSTSIRAARAAFTAIYLLISLSAAYAHAPGPAGDMGAGADAAATAAAEWLPEGVSLTICAPNVGGSPSDADERSTADLWRCDACRLSQILLGPAAPNDAVGAPMRFAARLYHAVRTDRADKPSPAHRPSARAPPIF